jgi:hypothetical protein
MIVGEIFICVRLFFVVANHLNILQKEHRVTVANKQWKKINGYFGVGHVNSTDAPQPSAERLTPK